MTDIATETRDMADETNPIQAPAKRSLNLVRAYRLALAAVLLVPVPSLAGTLVLGTWNYIFFSGGNTPAAWTTSSVGDNLTFQGAKGNTSNNQDSILVMYSNLQGTNTATTISAVTSNFNVLKTTGQGVNVSIVFANQSLSTITYIYGPNMFSGTLPSTLGTISNKPIPNGAFYIGVVFDFVGTGGGTTWTTVPSSPFQVAFSGF